MKALDSKTLITICSLLATVLIVFVTTGLPCLLL
jgi:hypothetical protein